MKINWTKLSAIAEIVSSIAIVVTLVYLAIQTQQNTSATIASTRHQIINSDLAVLQMIASDPSIGVNMNKKGELTLEEKEQLEAVLIAMVRTREHQWFQYRDGLLDQQTWEANVSGVTVFLSFPRTRNWWQIVSIQYFDDEFVNEMNSYLNEIPVLENYISPIN